MSKTEKLLKEAAYLLDNESNRLNKEEDKNQSDIDCIANSVEKAQRFLRDFPFADPSNHLPKRTFPNKGKN